MVTSTRFVILKKSSAIIIAYLALLRSAKISLLLTSQSQGTLYTIFKRLSQGRNIFQAALASQIFNVSSASCSSN